MLTKAERGHGSKDVIGIKRKRLDEITPPARAKLVAINGVPSPFLSYETTERPKKKRKIDGDNKENSKPKENQGITKELQQDYARFVKGELDRLINRWGEDSNQVKKELDHEGNHPFKVLFEKFTEEKPGSEAAGTPIRSIKKDALNEYLNTDKGFASAYELRKLKLQDMALYSGVLIDSNLPRTQLDTMSKNRRLTVNPGSVLYSSRLDKRAKAAIQWMERPAKWQGRELPYWQYLYPLSPFKQGEKITIEKKQQALHMAQDDDSLKRQFVVNTWRVDPRNLKINDQNQVVLIEGLISPALDPKSVRKFLTNEAIILREAELQMGKLPEHFTGVMDVQGLIPGREQFPLHVTTFEMKVQETYERDPRNVDSTSPRGNPYQFQRPDGEWVRNTLANQDRARELYPNCMLPAAAYDGNNVDHLAGYKLRRKIRLRLLAEEMERDIREMAEGKKNHITDALKILESKTSQAAVDAKKNPLIKEQELLTNDKDSLTEKFESFKLVNDRLAKIDAAKKNLTLALAKETGQDDAHAKLGRLNSVLTGPADSVDIIDSYGTPRSIRNIQHRENQANQVYTTELRTISTTLGLNTANRTLQEEAARRQLEQSLKPIELDKQLIKETIKAINDAQEEVKNSYFNLGPEENNKIQKTTEEMTNSLTRITGWGITNDQLARESYDELMELITQAYNTNQTDGWSYADKDKPENRMLLLHAMAEARVSARLNSQITQTTNEFGEATSHDIWAIPEVNLLTLSPEKLQTNLTIRADELNAVSVANVPTPDEINNLKSIAKIRFNARRLALEKVINELENRHKAIEDTKEKLTTKQTPILAATDRAVKRYNEIGEKIIGMPDQKFADLFSTKRTDISENQAKFSPAEREQGQIVATVNLRRLMFDYLSETDPDTVCRIYTQALSENDLWNLISDRFTLSPSRAELTKITADAAIRTRLGDQADLANTVRDRLAAGADPRIVARNIITTYGNHTNRDVYAIAYACGDRTDIVDAVMNVVGAAAARRDTTADGNKVVDALAAARGAVLRASGDRAAVNRIAKHIADNAAAGGDTDVRNNINRTQTIHACIDLMQNINTNIETNSNPARIDNISNNINSEITKAIVDFAVLNAGANRNDINNARALAEDDSNNADNAARIVAQTAIDAAIGNAADDAGAVDDINTSVRNARETAILNVYKNSIANNNTADVIYDFVRAAIRAEAGDLTDFVLNATIDAGADRDAATAAAIRAGVNQGVDAATILDIAIRRVGADHYMSVYAAVSAGANSDEVLTAATAAGVYRATATAAATAAGVYFSVHNTISTSADRDDIDYDVRTAIDNAMANRGEITTAIYTTTVAAGNGRFANVAKNAAIDAAIDAAEAAGVDRDTAIFVYDNVDTAEPIDIGTARYVQTAVNTGVPITTAIAIAVSAGANRAAAVDAGISAGLPPAEAIRAAASVPNDAIIKQKPNTPADTAGRLSSEIKRGNISPAQFASCIQNDVIFGDLLQRARVAV